MENIMNKALIAALAACFSLGAHAAEPIKIAFVDTGNTGRSVTAEALANAAIGAKKLHIATISRAVDMDPYDVMPEPNAAALLQQRGIDVSTHRAVQLSANDIRHSDLILTMTAKHKSKVLEQYPDAKAKVFTIAEYATGEAKDVADAWGKPLPVYVEMVQQVGQYVPLVLEKATKKPAVN